MSRGRGAGVMPVPGPAGRPSPPTPIPSVPRPEAGMQDGQSPSFPGALSVVLEAHGRALTHQMRGGMEGPRRVVGLGGPCMVAGSHPSSPLPANTANINIYEMISACLIHNCSN